MQEPDPSKDTTLTIDGKGVTVPQGKPKAMPAFGGSSFYNSEYLVSVSIRQRDKCSGLIQHAEAGLIEGRCRLVILHPAVIKPVTQKTNPVLVSEFVMSSRGFPIHVQNMKGRF